MKLSLRRELGEIERIVAARRSLFAASDLPDALIYPVDLATEELFVNMLRHNQQGQGPITLELEVVAGGVRVSLADHDAEPFDPASVPPVDISRPLNERQIGGLGLHLVRQLVGSVHYHYHNRCNTLSFMAREEPTDV
ncbi:ATP-binding protein [Parahaliea aestuarii]|uniref:ATP-binding protein n=1 Tax=Parahaliea aestuarii TaxID=1852021 RepID=A0A5C9A0Z5_9GAMM|nr:ATP-binding protein [Parahaliea aestuarii]TXS94428.1 ATP-binding protein [Parahaliea aestuarii]